MLDSAGKHRRVRRLCGHCLCSPSRVRARSILECVRAFGKRNRWLIALYAATFCAALPLLLHGLGDSYWQRSVYAYVTNALETTTKEDRVATYIARNEENVESSLAYLQTLEGWLNSPSPRLGDTAEQICSAPDVSVAVVIPSIVRNKQGKTGNYKPRYLTQVVAAYRQFLGVPAAGDCAVPGRPRLRFSLYICNAEVEPQSHWEARELLPYVQVIERNGTVWYDNTFEKEKVDYVFCISSTLAADASAQWVLVAEDDALPRSDVRAVLEELIDVRLGSRKAAGVISVKLYHPERLLAYTRPTPGKIVELLCIGLVLGTLTWALARRCSSATGRRDAAAAVACNRGALCALVVYYSLMAFAVGRVNLLDLRRASYQLYSLSPAPSCCTQAMLFTRLGAAMAASYLGSTRCKPGRGKDSALEDLYSQTPLRALTFEPNSYAHIGVFTALRDSLVDPRDV